MRRKPYPFEIIEEIRALETKAARVALEQLFGQLESAQNELRRARKKAVDHERARWRFETKRTIPKQGCSGADLQREASFALGLCERERLLKNEIIRAQSCYDRLRVEFDALRSALEGSHLALEAIERHHQKFNAEQRKERAKKTELECDDLFSFPR